MSAPYSGLTKDDISVVELSLQWIDFSELCLNSPEVFSQSDKVVASNILGAVRNVINSGEQFDYTLGKCVTHLDTDMNLSVVATLVDSSSMSMTGITCYLRYKIGIPYYLLECAVNNYKLTAESEHHYFREYARFILAVGSHIFEQNYVPDVIAMKMVTRLRQLQRADPAKARTNIIDMSWMRELYLAGKEAEKIITKRKTA